MILYKLLANAKEEDKKRWPIHKPSSLFKWSPHYYSIRKMIVKIRIDMESITHIHAQTEES